MSSFENDSSITEALESLTKSLPDPGGSHVFTDPPLTQDGPARFDALSGPFPADPVQDSKSLSLNGILDSLTSVIEQGGQHKTAPVLVSQCATDTSIWPPADQHEQVQGAQLSGIGNQLLELQQQFGTSNSAQGAQKPKSKAAAVAEAIDRLNAEAKAAAAEQSQEAAAPTPDFTLLSEQVEQTLHERQVHDQQLKEHRDRDKIHPHASAPPNHGRVPGGTQTVPLPQPPLNLSSHMRKPPHLPPAPPTLPPPAHPSLPIFTEEQLSAAGLRVLPSAAPMHPRPPQNSAPAGHQMQPVIIRPPTELKQGRGPVHMVPSGVHVIQPGERAPLQGFDSSGSGVTSTHTITKDQRENQKASPYPKTSERAPIVKPESNRVHGYRATGKSDTGAEAQPDSSHGRQGSPNRKYTQTNGQGAAPSSKVEKRANTATTNRGNPLKRAAAGFAAAANSQVMPPASSKGVQDRSYAPGARPGTASGNSKDKARVKALVTNSIEKKEAGPSAVEGSGKHAVGHAKAELLQSDKGLAQSQGYTRRPMDRKIVNGKVVDTASGEAMRSARLAVSAPKSNTLSALKGERGKVAPSQQKPAPQAQVGAGISLAERQGMLQGLVQKKALEGIGSERHSGADERQARAREQKAAAQLKMSKKRERSAMQQQALAEKSAMQAQADLSNRYVQHAADKKRRRHSEGGVDGGPRDVLKRSENGGKSGVTASQQDRKFGRQQMSAAREDIASKHKLQRLGKQQQDKGANRRITDAVDEAVRKSGWEEHDAKSKRLMFSKRTTQLDRSSEDDIEVLVPAQRTGVKFRSRRAPEDTPSLQAPRARLDALSGGAAAQVPDQRAEGMHGKGHKASDSTTAKISNLKEWGAEVDKLIADHQAYVGEGQSASKHATKAQISGVKREQRPMNVTSVALPNASDTRPGRVGTVVAAGCSVRGTAVQVLAAQSDVSLHEMGAQTEEADVRSSSVQTPSVWGRSTQCQTDVRGVHQVLRVGVPVTVDIGCQSDGLSNVPTVSEGANFMQRGATNATHALDIIEETLTHTLHAQDKQLQTHCRVLRQFISEVVGVAGVQQQVGEVHAAAEPEEHHTHRDADPRMPSSSHQSQQELGGEDYGGEHEPGDSDDEHAPLNTPSHRLEGPDLPPSRHGDTTRSSEGANLDERSQSGSGDADMHAQDSLDDVPSAPSARMQSSGISPNSSESPMDEDLEADLDEVFGTTEGDVGTPVSGGNPSPVDEGSAQGHSSQAEPPATKSADPKHRNPPTSSRPLPAAGYSAALSPSASYLSVMAHEEVSDDEMVLEGSPDALQSSTLMKSKGVLEDDRVHIGGTHPQNTRNLEKVQQPQQGSSRLLTAKPSSFQKCMPGIDGCADQKHVQPEPQSQVAMSAVLKSQILCKLSKMLPKANLEVATPKRIIKKLEIDLRVDIKSHSDFVKYWIDEYLRDPSSLAAAASEAAAQAAAEAAAGTADGAHVTGDGKEAEGAGGNTDKGRIDLAAADACLDEGHEAKPGSRAASTFRTPASESGWESPAVSTGTPPGTPVATGTGASGKGLVSRMHGPGPGGSRSKVGDGGIYVPVRKTAKEKFRSTMTNEQLAEAKAAAAAALG